MVTGEQSDMSQGLADAQVIWQAYNPYQNKVNVANITPEWVFITPDAPGVGDDAFNGEDAISSGLSQLLFLYPGAVRDLGTRGLDFTPLVMTGDESGQIDFTALQEFQGDPQMLDYARKSGYTKKRYIVGARIRGEQRSKFQMSDAGSPLLAQVSGPAAATKPDDEPAADSKGGETSDEGSADKPQEKPPERTPEVHVVYVGDIDLLSSEFLALRSQPDEEIGWEFDNVTFVLNILDSLAGDQELLEIRKRKTRHSTLKMVNLQTEEARGKALEEASKFKEAFEAARSAAEEKMQATVSKIQEEVKQLQEEAATGNAGPDIRSRYMAAKQREAFVMENEQMKFEAEVTRLEQERDRNRKKIERDMELGIRRVQTGYKRLAGLLPPIPPLLMGLLVWHYRRKREKEGVAASRLR